MRSKLTAVLTLVATAALAQARSPFLTLSGELQDSVGVPVVGNVTLTVRLYANSAAPVGQEIYSETFALTGVQKGRFAVKLGTAAPLDAGMFDITALGSVGVWAGLQVMGEAEMSPRAQLTSAPWALSADWSGLTSKPTAFPPEMHSHPVGQITGQLPVSQLSGVLPVANGGTGTATPQSVFVDLASTQSIAGNKTFSGNVNVTGTGSTIATEGWTNATLTAGWANWSPVIGVGYSGASFKKDPFGFIHIRGLIRLNPPNPGSIPNPVFVLPAAYRPLENFEYISFASNSSTSRYMVLMIVKTNGNVEATYVPTDITELTLGTPVFQ